jgi:hypothetical protein
MRKISDLFYTISSVILKKKTRTGLAVADFPDNSLMQNGEATEQEAMASR